MVTMYDTYHFSHDSAVVSLDETCDAVVDEDGEQTIDWEQVETVRVNDPPYAEAFDTKQFYKLPVTAARPINQKYHYGSTDDDNSGLVTLRKPRDELKQAAWSLDKRPVTLGHPETRMVKTMDDIHGFWSDVNYVDSVDNLDTNGYVPVGDEDAKEWIENHTDVSVGFHHKVTKVDEYDGTVGGTDSIEGVDGFQTDIYMNHCAFVGTGRCSDEDGCGLDTTPHGSTRAVDSLKKSPTAINNGDEDTDMEETVDQPSGIHEGDDGGLYGVAPDESPNGEAKYPMNSCGDVSDAWKLRGHGEYTIEQSTLETRIKRMADYHDCDMSFDEKDSLSAIDHLAVAGRYDITDCACDGCDCGDETNDTDTMSEFNIDINDLSAEAALDKLGESHEGIAELSNDVAEMREQVDTAQSVADSLDTDLDGLDERVEEVAAKAEKYDEMIDEKVTEKAERIAEIVDKYDEAEAVIDKHDGDYESISDELDVLESAIDTEETEESDTSQTTVDSGGGGESETEQKTRVEPDAWG